MSLIEPLRTEVVLKSDYDAAVRRAEEAERDLRLCRGHDIVAKFRMLAAERDDLLDKLIAERTRRETLEQLLREIEPYIDSVVCYASTVAEYPPNGLPERVRAALASGGSEHG